MMQALAKEAEGERNYLKEEKINSIYFGGGTPSILEANDLEFLLAALYKNYPVIKDVEITLEANPDDITTDSLKSWTAVGINRLRIGVQSFFEEELRWMNRAHNATQALDSIHLAKEHFEDITVDLIYGSPLLTDEMWKQNVERATELGIPHLSCYALTVEEKTRLHKLIHTHKTQDVDNDKQARQFLLLMQWLKEYGYEHYEVSNFAKPGFRSQHNSSYWKGEKYLGIGPSAHSYNGVERRWNIANNNIYTRDIQEGHPQRETEQLTSSQQLNEFIMISLRTKEGLDLNKLENGWGLQQRELIGQQVEKYRNNKLVEINQGVVQLTDEGMLRADGIASDLFVVA